MTDFGAPLTVTVDSARILALSVAAPVIVAEELRDAVGSIFGSTRRAWLQQIPHPGVKRLARRSVFYTVWPRRNGGDRPLRGPEDVLGVFHATSEAPGRHEFGGPIRAAGALLPVPIGRKGEAIRRSAVRAGLVARGTRGLDAFGRRGRAMIEGIRRAVEARGNSLVVLRNGAGDLVLYEREAVKNPSPGRPKRGRRRKFPAKLTPLLVLKRQTPLPARLGLYKTWRALAFDRQRRLNVGIGKAIDRMAKETVRTVKGSGAA